MFSIPQSTAFTAVFKAYQSSDHVTEATGKTIAITISKAGGAFGNPNAGATNATEISGGWYKVALDATDTGTVGLLALRGTASGIDDVGDRFLVEARPANFASLAIDGSGRVDLGKWGGTAVTLTSGLPDVNVKTIKDGIIAAATFAANALDSVWSTATRLLTAGTNIVLAKGTGITGFNDLDASGVRGAVGMAAADLDTQLAALPTDADVRTQADAALAAVGLTTTITGRIDADVSSRLAAAGYTAPDNASIAAIKASTDNLPSDPADQSLVIAATTAIYNRIGAPAGADLAADVAAVKSASDGIKAKTDNLPASPAATGDAMTLTAAYDAAKTAASQASVDDLPTNAELAAALGDLATTVTVDAIKAKTDSLTFTEVGRVDANIKAVNDVDVAGTGTSGAPWGPA